MQQFAPNLSPVALQSRAQFCSGIILQTKNHTIHSVGSALPPPNNHLVGEGFMKLITAIIKPYKLEDVREALSAVGVTGITLTEAKGFGRQKGHTELYRGAEYVVDFLPKLKLEIAVDDSKTDAVVEAILQSANTGKIGDGKVFVLPVESAIRIRTEETDGEAL